MILAYPQGKRPGHAPAYARGRTGDDNDVAVRVAHVNEVIGVPGYAHEALVSTRIAWAAGAI